MNNSLPYVYVNLTRWISSIVTPIILLSCAIGNIVSFFVLMRPRLRNQAISIYLAVLCVAEVGTCYTGLLRQLILDAFELDIRKINSFSCRVHIYLTYMFLRLAPLLLSLVTLQRYLYICQLATCSLKSAWVQLFGCILFVCLAEFHLFFFYDLTYSDTLPKKDDVTSFECTVDKFSHEKYYQFRSHIYPKLALVLYTIVPLTIIITGNVLIARTVRRTSKRSYSTNKKRSITRMLYAVSMLYAVLTSPAAIFLAIAPTSYQSIPMFHLQWTLLRLLFYSCHSVNFILFCVSGTFFRQEFVAFLKSISSCQTNCICRKFNHNNRALTGTIRYSKRLMQCSSTRSQESNENEETNRGPISS